MQIVFTLVVELLVGRKGHHGTLNQSFDLWPCMLDEAFWLYMLIIQHIFVLMDEMKYFWNFLKPKPTKPSCIFSIVARRLTRHNMCSNSNENLEKHNWLWGVVLSSSRKNWRVRVSKIYDPSSVVVKCFLQKSQKFYAPFYTGFSSSFLKLNFHLNFFFYITGVRHVGSLAEKN